MADTSRLPEAQRRALDRLKSVPALADFYLAGGTAVALHCDVCDRASIAAMKAAAVVALEEFSGTLMASGIDGLVIADIRQAVKCYDFSRALSLLQRFLPRLFDETGGAS